MNYFYNGKEVRNFTILKLIGKGSYASVYKVKRNKDNNIYAMKIMDGDRLSKKEKLGLITEINILSKNNNPYLLKFYEVFIENNFFHIIMEYAENKDLKSFIDYRKSKNSPLSYIFSILLILPFLSLYLSIFLFFRHSSSSNSILWTSFFLENC